MSSLTFIYTWFSKWQNVWPWQDLNLHHPTSTSHNEPLYQLSYMAGERNATEKTSSVIGFQHVCLFCFPYGDETTSATYSVFIATYSLPLCFATIPSSKLDCFHFSWRYMTTFTFPGNIWPLSLSSETPTYPSPTPLMASLVAGSDHMRNGDSKSSWGHALLNFWSHCIVRLLSVWIEILNWSSSHAQRQRVWKANGEGDRQEGEWEWKSYSFACAQRNQSIDLHHHHHHRLAPALGLLLPLRPAARPPPLRHLCPHHWRPSCHSPPWYPLPQVNLTFL